MKTTYTQNREISWLRFNERVLDEAKDKTVRPFEMLKFISIFTSNLTEFFMVRIGSLTDLSVLKKDFRENKTDMTASQQIAAVLSMLPAHYAKKDALYDTVTDKLQEYGVVCKEMNQLSSKERNYIKDYFYKNLFPLLSPQIIDSVHPFPFLENDHLYIFLTLTDNKKKNFYALLPVRKDFPKFIILQGSNNFSYILTYKVLLHYAAEVFKPCTIVEATVINVTRNFDFTEKNEIRDEFENYKDYMKAVIRRRTRQQAVRLELAADIGRAAKKFLLTQLKLNKENMFVTSAPLNMDYVFQLESSLPSAIAAKVCNTPFFPRSVAAKVKSKMDYVEKQDVMLCYPYDDMSFFLGVIKEAANDPRVQSIKITIYRLAKHSKLVQYLANASENGKDVTVVMELKARFDEQNNINYSEVLYNAGCNIIFGFEQYKIHSKICLITYKTKNTIKYITQIGTGNYNENTSKLYADFSLITGHKGIGLDAVDFFKNIATGNVIGHYAHLLQSPFSLKEKLLDLMNVEKAKGKKGSIFFKLNSLTDKDIIDKLVECSQAGVQIRMIIRGICCILPQRENLTENIEIRSIIGRFLEHARVYLLGTGEQAICYISSSDLMTRNTERRIEIAVPIYDKNIKEMIIQHCEYQWSDNVKGRVMQNNGELKPIVSKEPSFSCQDYFMRDAILHSDGNTVKAVKNFFEAMLKRK